MLNVQFCKSVEKLFWKRSLSERFVAIGCHCEKLRLRSSVIVAGWLAVDGCQGCVEVLRNISHYVRVVSRGCILELVKVRGVD